MNVATYGGISYVFIFLADTFIWLVFIFVTSDTRPYFQWNVDTSSGGCCLYLLQYIHIFLNFFSLVNSSSLVIFFKIMGITVGNMWFAQDVINCLSRTKTCCSDNLTGARHALVATGHLDHLCWFLKTWWVGLHHWKLDWSELEGLVSDFDLVISKSPSYSTLLLMTTWYPLMGS